MDESLDKEILRLVRSYCKPGTVSALVNNLKRAELVELRMAKETKMERGARRPSVRSLATPANLDLLITRCQASLGQEEGLQIVLGIGDLFKVHGNLARAEEMFTMALRQGKRFAQKGMVAEAYMRRGELHGRQGRWKESIADLGMSREIFQELREHAAVGRVENILGTNFAEQGKLHQARLFFERALSAFERTEQTSMTGTVLMNLGIIYNIMGDYFSALAQYKRAQSHFEMVGDLGRLAEVHHNAGMSYLSRRMLQEARHEFDVCLTLSAKTGNVNLGGLASLGRANVFVQQHDLSMAMKLTNQAIDAFTQCNDRLSMADGYKVKGMIHRAMGTFDLAESYLQTSLRINLDLNNRLNTAETYFEIGLLEKARGRRDQALRSFEDAASWFKKVGASVEAKRVEEEIHALGRKQ